MDALLLRRRMMMAAREPDPEGGRLSDYVQSGLVLHMDGKYGKGGDTWKSAVGNVVFTNNGAIFNLDNVEFDGSGYLSNTSFTTPAASSGTIEICYEENESNGIKVAYMPKTNYGLTWAFTGTWGSRAINWSNNGARSLYGPVPAKGMTSIGTGGAYGNGVALTSSGSNYLSGRDSSTSYIGKRSSGNIFKGKIYSIRIYNRKLTQAEVLKNLSVDNIRFNLGLTLETT